MHSSLRDASASPRAIANIRTRPLRHSDIPDWGQMGGFLFRNGCDTCHSQLARAPLCTKPKALRRCGSSPHRIKCCAKFDDFSSPNSLRVGVAGAKAPAYSTSFSWSSLVACWPPCRSPCTVDQRHGGVKTKKKLVYEHGHICTLIYGSLALFSFSLRLSFTNR